VASRTGDILLVDLATGEVRERMIAGKNGAYAGAIMAVLISPDGSTLWTEGHEGDVLAWDLTGRRRLAAGRDLPVPLDSGRVVADGQVAQVFAWNAPGEPATVAVLDATTGEVLVDEFPAKADARPDGPSALAGGITPDGSTALIGWTPARTGTARLRAVAVASGEQRFETALPWWPNGLDASRSEAFVAGVGGVVRVDLASGRITAQRDLPAGAYARSVQATVEVSPDGRSVAVSRDHEVLVLDAGTLATIASWPLGDDEVAHAMAWLPDGSALAFGGEQARLYVRNVPDGRERFHPGSVSALITDLAVSPDGTLLAALSTDGGVVLVDAASGDPIGRPLRDPPVGNAGLVRFADDGRALEVSGNLKRAYRYPIDIDTLIARACRIAAREPTAGEWTSMHGAEPQRPTCGDLATATLPPVPDAEAT
jgi:WD40 repeat protein